MTTLAPLAWRCAVELADHHRDRLTLEQLVRVEMASRRDPERLTDDEALAMVALFAAVGEGK